MWIKVKIPEDSITANFVKHLKEKYNLKISGVIKVLITHPEILDEINKHIDKYDTENRFKKYMDI